MTPPNQLGSAGATSPGPAAGPESPPETPQQPSFLGGGGQAQATASQSAARQLVTQMAEVDAALKGLAKSYPEMSESVDAAIQALTKGFSRAASSMQSRESEGNSPPYA